MRHTRFRYNPATCRYEPVPLTIKDFLGPLLLFVVVSSSLFVGLLFLHDTLFITEKEEALIMENNALSFHHDQLNEELISVNSSLAALHDADFQVERRWIADQTPPSALMAWFRKGDKSEFTGFRQQFARTLQKTASTFEYAQYGNYLIGTSMNISSEDLLRMSHIPSIQPVSNPELTKLASGYGIRTNPFHGGNYMHSGIDFVAPRGTPVLATASGTVLEVAKSELQMGAGNTVTIDHGNGFVTRYMHLGEIHVRQGQRVVKGYTIASVGLSGGSISPHLHYEVVRNNEQADPVHYILEDVSSTAHAALLHLAQLKNQSLD